MLVTFTRSILLYVIVLIVVRLMGKREIGQLQPFELVISIMIADLAAVPMADTGIPIQNGIIPILGLLFMHLIISIINMKSIHARKIICGQPKILIYRGKIKEEALRQERLTISELEEKLRSSNVTNLGDVEYAILETSGQLSVIYKPNKRPTIPEDFGIEPEYEGIPYDLVIDGVVMHENLKNVGKDINWLKKEVRKIRYKSRASSSCDTRRERSDFLPKEGEFGEMKKEAIITLIILILIIIMNVITQRYTTNSVSEVSDGLEKLRINLINNEDEKAKNEIKDIKEKWDKKKEKMVLYIEHIEIEKVEMYLTEVNSYIETKDYGMAIEALNVCAYSIDNMKDKYDFSLKNIF